MPAWPTARAARDPISAPPYRLFVSNAFPDEGRLLVLRAFGHRGHEPGVPDYPHRLRLERGLEFADRIGRTKPLQLLRLGVAQRLASRSPRREAIERRAPRSLNELRHSRQF